MEPSNRSEARARVVVAIMVGLLGVTSGCLGGPEVETGTGEALRGGRGHRQGGGGAAAPDLPTLVGDPIPNPASGVIHVTGTAGSDVGVGRVAVLFSTPMLGQNDTWVIEDQVEGSPTSYAFDYAIDTRLYPDGQYCIGIYVNDVNGNGFSGTTCGVTLTNEPDLPSLVGDPIPDPATGVIHITGTAGSDVGVGRVAVLFSTPMLGQNDTWVIEDVVDGAPTSYDFDYPIDTTRFADGQYCIGIYVNDVRGNGYSGTSCGVTLSNP
jgi:hypothetical protein